MLKSRVWLLIGAVLVISALKVLGQHPKKCADIDEYCQIHSDCCSNSCLTYLYRCTRNYNGVYPYTFFGERYPATGTVDDVMAFTFSNFGSIEEMKRHQNLQHTHQHPQYTHQHAQHTHPNVQYTHTHQMPYGFGTRFSDTEIGGDQQTNAEASVTEANTVTSTTAAVSTNTTSQAPQQAAVNSENTSSQAPQHAAVVSENTSSQAPQQAAVNSENKSEGDKVAVETRASEAVADCKAIGVKCFNNDECCTKRCHGFLHQCVT